MTSASGGSVVNDIDSVALGGRQRIWNASPSCARPQSLAQLRFEGTEGVGQTVRRSTLGENKVFKLGIISDEISSDLDRACTLTRKWGMEHIELRTIWDQNILTLSPEEFDRVGKIVDRHGLKVTAIASPIFKSPRDGVAREVAGDFQFRGHESFEGQLELIRRAAGIAKSLGTDRIRIFTFWREPWSDALVEEVAGRLIQAAALARELGVVLAVENEPVCVVGTGRELGDLFRVIDRTAEPELRDRIGMLWDPGNAGHSGEETPYPDGYAALDPSRIIHLHLKDSAVDAEGRRSPAPLGHGTIDYVSQLRRIRADGYRGALVLEPHYHPEGLTQEESALACVTAARGVIEEASRAP